MNKVIGIGLPKTGTVSITHVLRNNGIPAVHFGVTACEEIRQKMYRGIYKYDLLDNTTGLTNGFEMIFPQLDKTYPESKFIHTIRDKDVWLDSAEKHWERMMSNGVSVPMEIHHHLITFGTYLFNKDRFSYVYDMHKLMVSDYFKNRNDCLTIDITKDNTYPEKICDFLGIPCKDKTAQHMNKG